MNSKRGLMFMIAIFTSIKIRESFSSCPPKCYCKSKNMTLCSNKSLDKVPYGIPYTTTTLDLSYNLISILGNLSFNYEFEQLSTIYLYDNIIQNIDVGTFRYLKNLKKLYLYNNKLTYIAPHTFLHNIELQELDFHGNNFTHFNNEPFPQLERLLKLNLANCNLQSIHQTSFQKTVNIVRLDLSNNRIQYIETKLFEQLNSLKFLNLSGNALKSLGFLFEISTKNLQNLSMFLNNNKLENFNNNITRRLEHVKIFEIDHNPLFCNCPKGNKSTELCSKYAKEWRNYINNCLNEKVPTVVTKPTTIGHRKQENKDIDSMITYDNNTSTMETEIIANEEKEYNNSNLVNLGTSISDNIPESSSTENTVIISISLSVVFIIILSLTLIYYIYKRAHKAKLPDEVEYDTVPPGSNVENQAQFSKQHQCECCRVYENHTPLCKRSVTQYNKSQNENQEGRVQYAVQQQLVSPLETHGFLYDEEEENSALYVPMSDSSGKSFENTCPAALNQMQSLDQRETIVDTDMNSVGLYNIVHKYNCRCSLYMKSCPHCGSHVSTLPRQTLRQKYYRLSVDNFNHSPTRSQSLNNRSTRVKKLESQRIKQQQRPLPPCPQQTLTFPFRILSKRLSSSSSLNYNNEPHIYEEVKQ